MDGDLYHLPGLDAVPWKAPEATVGRAKGGGRYVMFHSDPTMKGFQEAVREDFFVHNPTAAYLHEEEITLTFWLWRNTAGHNQADATNCQKALEDALQGVLFANDRQVRDVRTVIVDQGPTVEPYIIIGVQPYAPSWTPKLREFAPPPKSITGVHMDGEDIGF